MTASDLKAVRRHARARHAAEQRFREAVLAAHQGGESLRVIAQAASLSHVRVLQIVRESTPVERMVADDLRGGDDGG